MPLKKGKQQKDDTGKHQTEDQSRQAPKASGSNRVRKSRKITQTEG
jgi:hypothetical protein